MALSRAQAFQSPEFCNHACKVSAIQLEYKTIPPKLIYSERTQLLQIPSSPTFKQEDAK